MTTSKKDLELLESADELIVKADLEISKAVAMINLGVKREVATEECNKLIDQTKSLIDKVESSYIKDMIVFKTKSIVDELQNKLDLLTF